MAVENLMSKYEAMRTDPTNWKLGVVYYCKDDPRIVVRNLLPLGWTWNFGHQKVYIALIIAVTAFLAPPFLAWQLGIRSALTLGFIVAAALITIVFVASRLALDPEA